MFEVLKKKTQTSEDDISLFDRIVETSILGILVFFFFLIYIGLFLFNEYIIFDAKTTDVHGLGGPIVSFFCLFLFGAPLAMLAIKRIIRLWKLSNLVWVYSLCLILVSIVLLVITLAIFWNN